MPIFAAVEAHFQGYEVGSNVSCHIGLWIRHGIQSLAACSRPLAEVDQQVAPLVPRTLYGKGMLCLPWYRVHIHVHAYQCSLPASPLKGPLISCVTQPP